MAAGLARLSRDAPARLALLPLLAWWTLKGFRGGDREERRAVVFRNVQEGLLPVGLGAALGGLILVVVFLLA
jgi:hypothetical protein